MHFQVWLHWGHCDPNLDQIIEAETRQIALLLFWVIYF